MIIVNRLGLAAGRPPAADWPGNSVEFFSLLIGSQRRLQNQLEQGESPGQVSVTA
jgi:hypothetical protein